MYILNKKTVKSCFIAEVSYILYRLFLHFFTDAIFKAVEPEKAAMFINTIPSILFCMLFLYLFREVIAENIHMLKEHPKYNLKQIVVCVIVTDILTVVYAYMSQEFGIDKSKNQEYLEILFDMNFWLISFVTCAAAPFVEEIIFRGLLQGVLIGRFKNRIYLVMTAVISGIVFGMAHCDFRADEMLTVIPNIIYGIMIGILYLNTKNIVCTTLVHMFVNIRATLSVLLMG